MKFITTTYFKDFARYFSFLEDEIDLRTNSDNDFFNVSIYPCAHHYFLSHNKHSVYLPSLTVEKELYNIDKDDLLLEQLIDFNKKSLALYNRNLTRELKQQALKYLNILDPVFEREAFDCLISSGDSRLLPSVTIYLAKKYNVKIIYFEQGPFNTTMLDELGVNANISFIPRLNELTAELHKRLENFKTSYKNQQVKKYWHNYNFSTKERIYNVASIFLLYPPKLLSKTSPADLQIGLGLYAFLVDKVKSKLPFNSNARSELEVKVLPKKYIGLYLQVPVDAQLIEHSPNYQCFYQMVSDVVSALPSDYCLIIREHPQYKNKYDNRIYDVIVNNPKIYLGNDIELNKLIINAEVNILNNSAVGIESLLLGTKVVTLGYSYYSKKGVTFDYTGDEPLGILLDKAINADFEQKIVDSFLYELVFEYLSIGHFQDELLIFPRFPIFLNNIFK